MSARKKKAMDDGWPQAYADVEFEPWTLPEGWGGFDHKDWPQKTEQIRQAAVIALTLCEMDRAQLRQRIGALASGSDGEEALAKMLELFRNSIERVKALQLMLEAAEARTYGAYAAVAAGIVEGPPAA